jgi:hypothetical protein
LQVPPKFTQIGIFGLKIYHLATLHLGTILGGDVLTIVAAFVVGKAYCAMSTVCSDAVCDQGDRMSL